MNLKSDLKLWFDDLDEVVLDSFELYAQELLRFNKAINLISSTTTDKLAKVHFADCVKACQIMFKHLPLDAQPYDLGAGNGFPGLVIALLRPEQNVSLVEKDRRKSEFLSHVADLLQLKNVTVLNQTVEDLPADQIQWAVSRAFAPLERALLLMRHKMRSGGKYFHFKSDTWSIELAHVPSQLFSVWKADHLGDYKIPETETLHAVICTTKL